MMRLEAIATRVEAIAIRLEAIAISLHCPWLCSSHSVMIATF